MGLGVVCANVIDSINILNATKQAMQLALSKLTKKYSLVITDAVKLKSIQVAHINPVKAEDKYISVAAASIIAKVYRDNLMINLSKYFPDYGWNVNMGYGTIKHFEVIRQKGCSFLHRKSFLKKYYNE
jgi:ribonuclease HII